MPNIWVLGPKDTFSDKAVSVYQQTKLNDYPINYVKSVFQVVKQINGCDLGILPIENTLEGFVQPHLDYLLEYDLMILGEIELAVEFKLVSNVDKSEITHIYCQYVTKNQCSKWLEAHENIKVILTDSNILSYEAFLENPKSAAIIPLHVKTNAYLEIANVADYKDNKTRFFVIGKKELSLDSLKSNNVKMFIVLEPIVDRPGLLYESLKVFKDKGINMISIMSRPTKKRMGTYHFYIELEGTRDKIDILKSAIPLLEQTMHVTTLGIYERIQ